MLDLYRYLTGTMPFLSVHLPLTVIDDFYNKRMGKGEIFYGKRKYKPSGTVEGDYNGLGLTDKQRIDDAREYKAQWEEERRLRREMAELRQQGLKKDFKK